MRVLAAVVTYNRCDLLERCVDHIRAQKRAADSLLVINNGSTDGTAAMLEAKGVDFITQENVGGAGGFNRALQEADERGFDAVWLMDDDGYPHPDALACLDASMDDGVSCVSSVVLCQDDPDRFVFPFPLLDRRGYPKLLSIPRKIYQLSKLRTRWPAELYPYAHLFNGALVKISAAREAGNINPDFFIMGDEVDFFMRLRKTGLIQSHLDARHLHPDVSKRPLNETKFYYYVKNSIIINRSYMNFSFLRNVLTVVAAIWRTGRRNSIGEALSYLFGSRARILTAAVTHGLKGRIARDFRP